MGKRPKRKIVLFLVEGKSDREALQIAISELFERIDDSIEVFFPIIREGEEERGGDITTSLYTDKRNKTWWVSPKNIEEAIYRLFLEDFFDEMKIMPKDISEIIQVVDLDGAYVSDACVLLDPALTEEESPLYTETSINCVGVDNIVRRNRQKRENLDDLSSRKTIKIQSQTKPYSVYYFSSNLDHFLHHNANLDYRQKVMSADRFSSEFIGDVEGFIRIISQDPGAANGMTYDESWSFIKDGTNSLGRHTNLDILLNRLLSEDKL